MLTVSQFRALQSDNTKGDEDANQRKQIVEHIDKVLSAHRGALSRIGIPVTRSMWDPANVEAVLAAYREGGWTVMAGGAGMLAYFVDIPR